MQVLHEISEQSKIQGGINPEQILGFLSECEGNPTERLVALLKAVGVNRTSDIARAIGVQQRRVQKIIRAAAWRPQGRVLQDASGPQDASSRTHASSGTPKSVLQDAIPTTDSRAHAYKESNHRLDNSSPKCVSEEPTHAPKRDVPHMNGVGFVISAKHGLVIGHDFVDRWRERYPHIPDLEALLANLSTKILARGPMHPGWECPEGWMVSILAEENARAEGRALENQARVERASRSWQTDRDAAQQKARDESRAALERLSQEFAQ